MEYFANIVNTLRPSTVFLKLLNPLTIFTKRSIIMSDWDMNTLLIPDIIYTVSLRKYEALSNAKRFLN